ncbi:MAG: Hpt domain-containing protein, partial [Steroidobacter sp.]
MALDLAQFHDAFFEESFEALDSMESALLKLNVGSPETELINTIFRTAHSIKGGSATFGFTEVASFTHTLETLLDELRGNRMQVSKGIMDLLLKTVDVVRDMLRAVQTKVPVDAQRIADLQFDLEVAIINKSGPESAAAPVTATSNDNAVANVSDTQVNGKMWMISFKPYPQLFAHGNDPLRMLRELVDLGQAEVVAHTSQLPSLKELDPESCFLSWDVSLRSEVTRDVIAQVFDWAEGDCHLDIAEQQAAAVPRAMTEEEVAVNNVVPIKAAPKPAAETEGNNRQAVGDSSSIRVSIEKIDELMNTVEPYSS